LDAGGGILSDLQSGGLTGLIGAAQKAGTAYNTFKGANLKSIALSEATALGVGAVKAALPGGVRAVTNSLDGMIFPTATAARNQATVDAINRNAGNGTGGV
jgi:hypothetical protein